VVVKRSAVAEATRPLTAAGLVPDRIACTDDARPGAPPLWFDDATRADGNTRSARWISAGLLAGLAAALAVACVGVAVVRLEQAAADLAEHAAALRVRHRAIDAERQRVDGAAARLAALVALKTAKRAANRAARRATPRSTCGSRCSPPSPPHRPRCPPRHRPPPRRRWTPAPYPPK
jgi:hypothetical protein